MRVNQETKSNVRVQRGDDAASDNKSNQQTEKIWNPAQAGFINTLTWCLRAAIGGLFYWDDLTFLLRHAGRTGESQETGQQHVQDIFHSKNQNWQNWWQLTVIQKTHLVYTQYVILPLIEQNLRIYMRVCVYTTQFSWQLNYYKEWIYTYLYIHKYLCTLYKMKNIYFMFNRHENWQNLMEQNSLHFFRVQ